MKLTAKILSPMTTDGLLDKTCALVASAAVASCCQEIAMVGLKNQKRLVSLACGILCEFALGN